ncbi:MAG: hypothetical protein GVY22_01645 [Gammaproteobacteria bacterium]|jgi:hypothetical protein|nr:hypothetical protein [Gammaproteobacteria bacterium]
MSNATVRTLRLNYLSELPNRVQARLLGNSKLQTTSEDRWAKRLGLAIAPRLSLVDEENASLITGAERAFLEQQEEAEAQKEPRPDERKTA